MRRFRPLRQGWAICQAFRAIKHAVLRGLVSRVPLLYSGPASVGARKQLVDISSRLFFFQVSFIVFIENGRQHPHIQTGLRTSTPPEPKPRTNHTRPKRPQPTRLDETKVPCGGAYIIWPRKAVSLNICACQYCTPTKPNTFSTDHTPPRNTSYRQVATNCSTLHHRRQFTARPLLLRSLRTGVRKQSPHRGAETKRVPNVLIRIPHGSVRCLRTGRSLRTPVR